MKAIIAAAGWKGAGAEVGLAGYPESFLPLGDGTTTLSRTATILVENGFEIYTALGTRGYSYDEYKRAKITDSHFPWDASPWTQKRYDYAKQFGEVLEMPDPGGWSRSLDTFCAVMDIIGEKNWDHLFLACGDMLVPRNCFEFILNCEIPFVFSFTAFHVYFCFDKAGAQFFREYAEPFRRFDTEDAWLHEKNASPSYWGVSKLKIAGFNAYGRNDVPVHEWIDIDICDTYRRACKMLASGEIE